MRILSILSVLLFTLSACGDTGSNPSTPYVAVPIADLAAGTSMVARGNTTGWWRADVLDPNSNAGENRENNNGPKLQRIETTATAGVYEVRFRTNKIFVGGVLVQDEIEYGTAVFIMPGHGAVVSGTTDLEHGFTITNNNNTLTYTLTGLFSVKTRPGPTAGRSAYGSFVVGSHTPVADLPTTGSATYTGQFIGQSSWTGAGNGTGVVTGDATLAVNFDPALSTNVSGGITNISDQVTGETINDITISAKISPVDGSYSGIVAISSDTALGTTTGPVDGGFYGPNADETGYTLRLSNGTYYLSGAVGAVQIP